MNAKQSNGVRAFAPGHITGFFQIFENGSTGAGLNTEMGAHTSVELCEELEDTILLNGERVEAAVSQAVLEAYADSRDARRLRITHRIEFPIGYGMGMSGAGAFSLSLALNEFLGIHASYKECMEIAKRCEISCGTGLGDVVAQQFPGVMIGLPPYPSETVELIDGEETFVACAFFEPLSTGSIIRDPKWVERINAIGGECMIQLRRSCSRQSFMELSRYFALETKLPSEQVLGVMDKVPDSSMAMLGQSVFSLCRSVEEGIEKFEPFAEHIVVSKIAETGARVCS